MCYRAYVLIYTPNEQLEQVKGKYHWLSAVTLKSYFSSDFFFISDNNFQGIVYTAGNYTDPPYVAAPFTIPDQRDSMLYLAFSEYFFQTFSFAYYTAGAFNITIAEEVSRTLRSGVRIAQVIQDGALTWQFSLHVSIELLIGLWNPETVDQKD